ncbi:MAG: hypothetical protein ACSHX6_07765 [Akkermansiaceae bacterium]
MDSINSWINEDEVRKLAEDLAASPEVSKEWRDNNFDGFAIPEKQGEITKQLVEKEEDIAQAVKDIKSSSLAGASAMAASAGLLGGKKSEVSEIIKGGEAEVAVEAVKEKEESKVVESAREVSKSEDEYIAKLPATGDHSLNVVPVNVEGRAKVKLTTVHPEKELGTFEQIDKQLASTVKAKGICVIDRDGDVLYSSLKNENLVAFVVDAMMGTKLMRTQEREFGNIRLKISAREYLEFISVKSTRGVIILAASMDHVLGSKNAEYVAGDMLKIADMV